ncbi:kinase-like protein [Marasmius fiardii PR-910]|nr:kinase-like protein [Marasmius fiardii PR-910]
MYSPRKPTSPVELEQVLQHVQAIINDESQLKELLNTDGQDAQEWLDLFQLLAEYPNISTSLRSWIFKLMVRLSRRSGLYPQCLTIRNVNKLGNHPVGGGAFGDVWKGRIGQQLVCLKVIRAFEASDVKQVAKDYMSEAIIWRQLNHENLLPFMGIYYLDVEQRQLCLVSPWMEQGNLVQYLKNAPPELVDHYLLAYDVARGLSYLHATNIVHGDLKGVNILVTPDLRACIGDFGLSRVSATQRLLSESSHAMGTMRWLSPELLQPGPASIPSRESDIYAYGCVCYEIFTGRLPFHELTDTLILFAILINREHPSRPQDWDKSRDSMWNMMAACWNETPSLRPKMVDVVARILEITADRRLEPASKWSDPAFTQIWNDVDRPPVMRTGPPLDRAVQDWFHFMPNFEEPLLNPFYFEQEGDSDFESDLEDS